MARAATDVQTAVDTVTTLTEDAKDPVVRRGIWRDRVNRCRDHRPDQVANSWAVAMNLSTRFCSGGGHPQHHSGGRFAPQDLDRGSPLSVDPIIFTMAEIAAGDRC